MSKSLYFNRNAATTNDKGQRVYYVLQYLDLPERPDSWSPTGSYEITKVTSRLWYVESHDYTWNTDGVLNGCTNTRAVGPATTLGNAQALAQRDYNNRQKGS